MSSRRNQLIGMLASLCWCCVEGHGLTIDYPVPYVLVQRDSEATGRIRVRGAYDPHVEVGTIEARFRDGPWQVIDASPGDGRFAGILTAAVGQGTLEVRVSASADVTAQVSPVCVGDLFVIAGQSNADGRGTEHIQLRPENPCLGVKFRAGKWSLGDDPSSDDGKYGSPWPMVLNELIPELQIPIGFIQTAVGSTVVKQWRRGGRLYDRMIAMIKTATDGTMNVKAVCYYQGENDITHYNTLSVLGDYAQYKSHLLAAAAEVGSDLKCPLLVGQITNLLSMRERNDGVRRAQQESWDESPHARRGAVTYDIRPTDGVHYRDQANMGAFAHRWSMAMLESVYDRTQCRPARLTRAVRADERTIRLEFDRKLGIATWDGKPAEKALGFRLQAGAETLTDTDVIATEVDGAAVTVTLRKAVPAGSLLYYGSGADAQGCPVLRDVDTQQPVMMLFEVPVSP